MCSLATEQRVLCQEPHAGTAEASIFKLSPKFFLSNACSPRPAHRFPFFFFFLTCYFQGFEVFVEVATGQSLAGKNPVCRGGIPRGCCADEGAGGWVGSEPQRSGRILGVLRERRRFGIRYSTSCGQKALPVMQLGAMALVKRFTSPSDLQKSPPAFARSSAGGWSIWRGGGQGKQDFCSIELGF